MAKINIFVYMGMGGRGTSTFHVSPNRLVSAFIQDVVDKEGALGVRIICLNKSLEPNRNGKDLTLADYGVYNNITMHAALRLKGGAAEGPSATVFDIPEVTKLGAEVLCDPAKPNGPKGDCIIGGSEGCYESNIPKAKLACGCIRCADCMQHYTKTQINNSLVVKLHCGDTSHGNSYIDIGLAFAISHLSPDERNELVSKMASHQFQRPDSMMSYCPNGKCQKFVFREDSTKSRVECGVCHKFMCWKCKKEHKGKQDDHCGNDGCDSTAFITMLMSEAVMKEISGVQVTDRRICTNNDCCAVNIHETACKHMTCAKCKHQYCHICLQNWKGHNNSLCKVAAEQEIKNNMK
eukprot:78190_1